VYGNDDGQTATRVVLVVGAFTIKINVGIESVPPAPTSVGPVYVPAALYDVPFQIYGNAEGQTRIVVVLVTIALTFKINFGIESQPVEFVNVGPVYVPAALYDVPFQIYGNAE
jgi:hypothetical protein